MEAVVLLVLAALAFIGGAAYKGKQNKNKEIKERVVLAKRGEKEGVIRATLARADKIKRAEKAVAEKIADRPVTGDPVADLSGRVRRPRKYRRRRRRQRPSPEKLTD